MNNKIKNIILAIAFIFTVIYSFKKFQYDNFILISIWGLYFIFVFSVSYSNRKQISEKKYFEISVNDLQPFATIIVMLIFIPIIIVLSFYLQSYNIHFRSGLLFDSPLFIVYIIFFIWQFIFYEQNRNCYLTSTHIKNGILLEELISYGQISNYYINDQKRLLIINKKNGKRLKLKIDEGYLYKEKNKLVNQLDLKISTS